jgi:hypothetical protein
MVATTQLPQARPGLQPTAGPGPGGKLAPVPVLPVDCALVVSKPPPPQRPVTWTIAYLHTATSGRPGRRPAAAARLDSESALSQKSQYRNVPLTRTP